MRNVKVIFSQADKELAEKLHHRYKKLADKYLALNYIFTIIAGIALTTSIVLLHFTVCATVKKSSHDIPVAITSLIFAGIILLLISYVFQKMHNNYFMDVLHYQFMFEHMQEISEYENSLMFSVSKTCPNAVIYNLPDGRGRRIDTINNIPADSDVIITVKEDTDAKGRISLNWYAKTVIEEKTGETT